MDRRKFASTLLQYTSIAICLPQLICNISAVQFEYINLVSSILFVSAFAIMSGMLVTKLILGLLMGMLINYMHGDIYSIHPSWYIDAGVTLVWIYGCYARRKSRK